MLMSRILKANLLAGYALRDPTQTTKEGRPSLYELERNKTQAHALLNSACGAAAQVVERYYPAIAMVGAQLITRTELTGEEVGEIIKATNEVGRIDDPKVARRTQGRALRVGMLCDEATSPPPGLAELEAMSTEVEALLRRLARPSTLQSAWLR
jgi:hypothetical protein